MKHLAWMSAGMLALVGWASPCAAQGTWTPAYLPVSEDSGGHPPIFAPFRGHPQTPRLGTPCPPLGMPERPDTTPTTPTTPPSPTTPTTEPTSPTSSPDFSSAGE